MTDIELVIKIPEHYYENNIKKELPIYLSEDNIVAILPKGHGRLIDKDKTKCSNCGKFGCENSDICSLYHAQTIIEADGGDAE